MDSGATGLRLQPATSADAALARAASALADVLWLSAIASGVVRLDSSLLWCNVAFCRLFRRPVDVIVASSWQELTHPDDVDVDAAMVAAVMAGERASYQLRKRYLRPDGSVVRGDLTVTTIRSDDGEIVGFLGQVLDVTAEVERTEHFRILAENATDFVTESGADRVLRWVSPGVTALLGWSPDELVGTRFSDLVHPDDRFTTGVASALPECAMTTPSGGFAKRLRCKDGSYRHFSLRTSALPAQTAEDARFIGSWRDVEAEALAAEELRRSERTMRAVVSTMPARHMLLEAVRDGSGRLVDMLVIEANQETADLLGLGIDRLRGALLSRSVPEAGFERALAWCAQVLEDGVSLTREGPDASVALGVMDDQEHRFDVRAVLVEDKVSLWWRDSDADARAQDPSADDAVRFRAVAESTAVVLLVDRDGRIAWVAPRLAKQVGAADSWVGVRLRDVCLPSSRSAIDAVLAAAATGRAINRQIELPAEDGAGCRWVAEIRSPGARAGDLAIVNLVAVEDVVARFEETFDWWTQYRLLSEHMLDVVVRMRGDRIDWVSPSVDRVFGFPPERWLGRTLSDVIGGRAADPLVVEPHDPLVEPRVVTLRARIVDADGLPRIVEVVLSLHRNRVSVACITDLTATAMAAGVALAWSAQLDRPDSG